MTKRNHITGAVQETDPFDDLIIQCKEAGMTAEDLQDAINGHCVHRSQSPLHEFANENWKSELIAQGFRETPSGWVKTS